MKTDASPKVQRFEEEWARYRAGCPPIAWMLRAYDAVPWLRFHALPESKRYPESKAERAIVLSRANELGERVLGPGTSTWQIETLFKMPAEADAMPATTRVSGAGELAGEVPDPDNPGERWEYYITESRWRAGAFDRLLIEITKVRPKRIMWFSRQNGAAFAPYDGGFDIFPSSFEDIAALKRDYADWLSPHPGGL
ncbi:MAG TPA: hypothetical protein VGB65_00830 [Allosphingosinicella sp.]|jgi:hypothetical protein